MRVLIVGAGVIGTVYGAHLSSAGHRVRVLSHLPQTESLERHGLTAQDVRDGTITHGAVQVVADAAGAVFDLVLVAVRSDQLALASSRLSGLREAPAVVCFGNNPAGRAAFGDRVNGEVMLGFPGVGGVLETGIARYLRIPQQPTALPVNPDARLGELERTLRGRGFAVRRVADMDGWLAYHAAFVACVAAALYRCGSDPGRLAADRALLGLMCTAVTEAFTALRRAGTHGLPRNLAILHGAPLRPVAIRYWGRYLRSPLGELCFAAHCRRAEPEMRALAVAVSSRVAGLPGTDSLHRLLGRD